MSTTLCTAVGALTISGIGLGLAPYVRARAPLDGERRAVLLQDFRALVGAPPPLDAGQAAPVGLRFEDLQRPWLFGAFTQVARVTFAFYADATGVMTPTEFRCALHKMIDIAVSWYGSRVAPDVQAAAVRKLCERIADGAFRVIDEDSDGAIDAAEFIGAVLLVLAVANGHAVVDAPILRRLAFRVVDADGDGFVEERELLRWVELAIEHKTAPPEALFEPRGPFGFFGTRTLSASQLTRKWLRKADSDGDRKLTLDEFASVSPSLRIHELIRHLAQKFAIQ